MPADNPPLPQLKIMPSFSVLRVPSAGSTILIAVVDADNDAHSGNPPYYNRYKMENLKTNWKLSEKAKNPRSQQEIGCGEIETFWKQQEKVENSAEKLQNGAAGAGKSTPSRPTKKPSRLKMVGHLYKTHLENRSSTSLILCDTTKKKACDIFFVTGLCPGWSIGITQISFICTSLFSSSLLSAIKPALSFLDLLRLWFE